MRFHRISRLLSVGLFLASLVYVFQAMSRYGLGELLSSLQSFQLKTLLLALSLTALCYLLLTFYDLFAFQYVGRTVSFAKIIYASFIGYSLSNNVGLVNLTGAAVRYRLYRAWGVSPQRIAQLIAFYLSANWIGFLVTNGLVFVLAPPLLPPHVYLPIKSLQLLGTLFLILVGVVVGIAWKWKKPIRIFRREIILPSNRLFLQEIGIAAIDWAVTGVVLFVLLPQDSGLSYLSFLGIYLVAHMVAIASHVPGGLGVFEGTLILFLSPLSPTMPTSALLASLLVYRVIYFFIPMSLGLLMLGAFELFKSKKLIV